MVQACPDDGGGRCTADFLGADWHDGRLALLLLPPSAAQWAEGTRTFRCDLVELRGLQGDALPRAGSLKDGLRGDRPVGLGCGTADPAADLRAPVTPGRRAASRSGRRPVAC